MGNRFVNSGKLTVICLKHFVTPCVARPMKEGSQCRPEDVILLNQCRCNDAGLRVMVHSLVHPVLNVALQFHPVSLFAWCGKKCEPQSFKIASHRKNDPIFGLRNWSLARQIGARTLTFQNRFDEGRKSQANLFYMFLLYICPIKRTWFGDRKDAVEFASSSRECKKCWCLVGKMRNIHVHAQFTVPTHRKAALRILEQK